MRKEFKISNSSLFLNFLTCDTQLSGENVEEKSLFTGFKIHSFKYLCSDIAKNYKTNDKKKE